MTGFRHATQKARAKQLRSNMTEAEKRLWHHLRAHRFFGLSVRRQAPIGPYIVDFLIPAQKLVIEVDGGQHADNPQDATRDAYLAARGYTVLRYWNPDVLGNLQGVLEDLRRRTA
ncbi:endonuclease domain-containing protein [Psychromarinibacter sp. S121]|uniref:endonuclease domain-containing protein n=1 Tax=Psychromarinibacter sp. S121 TaxID=3415127 RepID=UPI003C7AC5C5